MVTGPRVYGLSGHRHAIVGQSARPPVTLDEVRDRDLLSSPRRTMPARPILALALALPACGVADQPVPADGSAANASQDDGPSAYTWEPEEEPAPTYDAATVEAALADVVYGMLTIGSAPVLDTYFGLMDTADADCPVLSEQDGNVFWYGQCTAGSGAYFDGYAFTYIYDGVEMFGEGGGLWDAITVSGVATIRDNAGHAFHLGGQVYSGTGHGDDGRLMWASNVVGGFAWDGEDADQSWLGEGISHGLYRYAAQYPGATGDGITGNSVYVNGTIGGLGAAATGADIRGFWLIHEALGMLCELEPGGDISVRDADGAWWDIDFDLEYTDSGWQLTGECDGCGGVYRDGVYQGEVCADFSPLLDWIDRPW